MWKLGNEHFVWVQVGRVYEDPLFTVLELVWGPVSATIISLINSLRFDLSLCAGGGSRIKFLWIGWWCVLRLWCRSTLWLKAHARRNVLYCGLKAWRDPPESTGWPTWTKDRCSGNRDTTTSRPWPNRQVRGGGIKPRGATVVARGPEWGLHKLSWGLSLPAATWHRLKLRAPSCRLGSDNQNRGGIHPSPNKLHSANKPKPSWWCCAVAFFKQEM